MTLSLNDRGSVGSCSKSTNAKLITNRYEFDALHKEYERFYGNFLFQIIIRDYTEKTTHEVFRRNIWVWLLRNHTHIFRRESRLKEKKPQSLD